MEWVVCLGKHSPLFYMREEAYGGALAKLTSANACTDLLEKNTKELQAYMVNYCCGAISQVGLSPFA
jgi:hypothetical protein